MSSEQDEIPDEESQRSWADRIAEVADTWSALAQTRLAIFREEMAVKRAQLVKGAVGVAIAIGLAAGSLLLFAAFVAALLAHLFGSVVWGILGALVVFVVGAVLGGWLGVQALSRVKPFVFPASQDELSKDWRTLRASWSLDGSPPGTGPVLPVEGESKAGREAAVEDLEERFRAGAE